VATASDPACGAAPWLYGIARRILANQRRASERRIRLFEGLRADSSSDATTPELARGDGRILEALRRLRPDDQELVRLVVWEGLGHAAIAVVRGTVAIRLHRARARFAAELERPVLKGSRASRTSVLSKGRSFGRLDRRTRNE
jgi:RNA polymerase sigma-70 factor (ECF subfamily)